MKKYQRYALSATFNTVFPLIAISTSAWLTNTFYNEVKLQSIRQDLTETPIEELVVRVDGAHQQEILDHCNITDAENIVSEIQQNPDIAQCASNFLDNHDSLPGPAMMIPAVMLLVMGLKSLPKAFSYGLLASHVMKHGENSVMTEKNLKRGTLYPEI